MHSYDSEMLNISFRSLCILLIKSNKIHTFRCADTLCAVAKYAQPLRWSHHAIPIFAILPES